MSENDPSAWCLRLLRRFREATLSFGDRRAAARFVIDRTNGRIVMPVETEAGRHSEFTLFLPSESDCDASVMLAPARIDRPEGSEAVDRWSVYHGEPPTSAVWTASRVLGLKSMVDAADSIFDEATLTVPNTLGVSEFALIRRANADRQRLIAASSVIASIDIPDARCIGVDPDGLDVRAPFGIVRLEFPYAAVDVPTAELMLTNLLNSGESV